MKRLLILFSTTVFPLFTLAQNDAKKGLDDKINQWFDPIATWWQEFVLSPIPIAGFDIPIVLILLVCGALFFTLYFGFINIVKFPLAVNVVRGKYDDIEGHGIAEGEIPMVSTVDGDIPDTIRDESKEGEVSHFQALATAVSGTVGLGNIAGVAIAIAVGGPGATFWMIICGLLGMSSKFTECTLGVKYRDVDDNGVV